MSIRINGNSKVENSSGPIEKAARNLRRDLAKSFVDSTEQGASIGFKKMKGQESMEAEAYVICVQVGKLIIQASDELGFIYGIYEISRTVLGISDFWFWNDQQIIPREQSMILAEDFRIQSTKCRVKYRGWFINDEVLLHKWFVDCDKEKPWEMALEALLRCKGNMVIPGTDRNSERYRNLASSMGFYVTHHHAEPLGARMFARAYPDLEPSYANYPEKFMALWQEAIIKQKDQKIIWNLGFRGQGDCPFWENDPQYKTDEARGALMSSLIKKQYELVKESNPDAVCCTNLYGETMELYKKGHLKLPEDVMKIWADNGYGKMVSRRQGNHNPRIPALPVAGNHEHNGVYYHVSFYDLQAANHITMLPNAPEFVQSELTEVLNRNGDDYWIINCSNVKPHVYLLDVVAKMWRDGTLDVKNHRRQYVQQYYGEENADRVDEMLKLYPEHALAYGNEEDEHAGEQFSNHVARMLLSQYMRDKNKRCEELLWAVTASDLSGQVVWYQSLCETAIQSYESYLKTSEQCLLELHGSGKVLFEDSILLQVKIHTYCYEGAKLACEAMLKAYVGAYMEAFYLAGKARKQYLLANQSMRDREHGKWKDFYENECLTDVKQTAWVLEAWMSYIRNLGEGPHFYQWQRQFICPKEDQRIFLILNMDNHLKDEELFERMEAKWDN